MVFRPFGSTPLTLFRVLIELFQGMRIFGKVYPAISIFGSARISARSEDYSAARTLAQRLGQEGFTILTGGGPSLMEAANRGAREVGAPSFACNIRLPNEQRPNPYIDRALTMRYFFTRKFVLTSYSVGFVCFPGGFGTLDELFEVLTLMQTEKIPRRPVFFVGSTYWKGLDSWLRETVLSAGAIGPESISLYKVTDDMDEIVEALKRTKNEIDHKR